MRRPSICLSIFVLCSALALPALAVPNPLPECMWAVKWYNNAKLYDIDPSTGATSNPRSLNANLVADIAWDGAAEVLYAVTGIGGTPTESALYTVDPASGAMTLVGSTGINVIEGALAIDPTTGDLYMMVRNRLYSVDKSSGAATLLGTANMPGAGQPDVSGMAFDVAGGLHAYDNRSLQTATTLYQLDKSNAAVLGSVGVSPKLGAVGGFVIDPKTGTHYIAEGNFTAGGPDFQTLDPFTGNLAFVGSTGLGYDGVSGLAICDPPPSDCVTPPTNMVSWWTFDEGTGPTADDIVAGKFGVLYGGASWTTGLVDGGLYLDGFSDYFQVLDTQYLNPWWSDFSLDLWIKTTDTHTVSVIYDKRHKSGSSYYGYEFFLYKGYLALQLATGGYSNYVSGSSGGTAADGFVADGEWHMVAVTVDRDDPQGIRWYIDGVEVGTRRNPTNHFNPIISSGRPTFGRSSLGSSSYLNGIIDEFEIFARPLDPAEIEAIYSAGSHGKCK